LTIHVVGASDDAELWGGFTHTTHENARTTYAVMLAEAVAVAANLRVVFVGPECPEGGVLEKDVPVQRPVDGSAETCRVALETHRCDYGLEFLGGKGGIPDIVVFFNPGFTCPDYTWHDALAAIPPKTPFMVATNTEMEGAHDCQYLLEKRFISELPDYLDEILGGQDEEKSNSSEEEDESKRPNPHPEDGPVMFFGENPFAGSRVRQSGTMANDLYVKSRWIFGGIMSGDHSNATCAKKRSEPNEKENGQCVKKN